ncbi:MAG: hypothetical protein M4579_006417 [Chaenotheca gracillima]|nr:MAG: hypothetical protein M4579_006417 [Chaenotheca gracillima]
MASADTQVKISSEATQNFVEGYYPALMTRRSAISSYYESPTKAADGRISPVIIFNGNTFEEPKDIQELFDKKMQRVHYDIQSYDCHIVNPNYTLPESKDRPAGAGRNMSILISVNGTVQFGDPGTAEERGFSESFVLIPNKDYQGARGRGSGKKEWLIQHQNFRLVV